MEIAENGITGWRPKSELFSRLKWVPDEVDITTVLLSIQRLTDNNMAAEVIQTMAWVANGKHE